MLKDMLRMMGAEMFAQSGFDFEIMLRNITFGIAIVTSGGPFG